GCTVFWTNPGSGNWEDPANWSTNPSLPGTSADVCINVSGITVSISSANATINSLISQANITLSGGTLAPAAASTINGTFAMTNGLLAGAGTLTLHGGLT